MGRPAGKKNIVHLKDRTALSTTNTSGIIHLSENNKLSHIEQFKSLLRHQNNYLNWIDDRHEKLTEYANELDKKNPKGKTYKKYRWYAEQLVLLESINAFESYYKATIIGIAESLHHSGIPPLEISGKIDRSVIWEHSEEDSLVSLLFESNIYHDLSTIDKATKSLVGAERYKPSQPTDEMREIVRSLKLIFQIRHTLSHNKGRITKSDAIKFKTIGYQAAHGEVFDPTIDQFGWIIKECIKKEATEFNKWILKETANRIKGYFHQISSSPPVDLKSTIERSIGGHPDLTDLNWI